MCPDYIHQLGFTNLKTPLHAASADSTVVIANGQQGSLCASPLWLQIIFLPQQTNSDLQTHTSPAVTSGSVSAVLSGWIRTEACCLGKDPAVRAADHHIAPGEESPRGQASL